MIDYATTRFQDVLEPVDVVFDTRARRDARGIHARMRVSGLSRHLRRHRRLLALCGVSALVHLALLEWFSATSLGTAPLPRGEIAAEDLVLRLAPAAVARREDGRREEPADAAPAQPSPAPATAPSKPAQDEPAPATPVVQARELASTDAATPATPEGQQSADAASDAAPPVQMPGRYRVRMPDAVLLTYTQTRRKPSGAPQRLPDAHIAWRSDGERYALKMDGVLGRLSSHGGSADAGVRPRSASEEREGRLLPTEFADGEVRFGASGSAVPDSVGIQDRASLLMQLAGIGLGDPEQIVAQAQGHGTVDVVVAGTLDATIERFQVIGIETLATPLGAIAAWHLALVAAPGRPRLEVWLAPERGWLPLQLRLTGADGSAATQTASAIAAPPPG